LRSFYRRLLPSVAVEPFHSGEWRLCTVEGWPDNHSCNNLVAWCWRKGEERRLVVVNLADAPSQGKLRVPWDDLPGKSWQLVELFEPGDFVRSGDEMHGPGIYVELPPWGYHLLTCRQCRPLQQKTEHDHDESQILWVPASGIPAGRCK
jgi:hypothetical protein